MIKDLCRKVISRIPNVTLTEEGSDAVVRNGATVLARFTGQAMTFPIMLASPSEVFEIDCESRFAAYLIVLCDAGMDLGIESNPMIDA